MVITERIKVKTMGHTDVMDISEECSRVIVNSGLSDGIITVFNPGSTGGLSTIEYEPNLIKDLKDTLDGIAPYEKTYRHGMTWNDDNGSSHMRSTIIGPSLTVPFVEGKLTLGTWQQIIFCDFDTRSRSRELIIQIIGE